jgi:membrane protein DedA with SNARE-associated domain
MLPFVLAAGAMQYPVKKFVCALLLGRAVRYGLLAFLAARYGRRMLAYFTGSSNAIPIAIVVIIVVCVAGTLIVVFSRHRPAN